MKVESVAWVTEQKGLLSTLFLLSSFLAYSVSEGTRDTFRQRDYYLSLGLFILSMLRKAYAAVLPLVPFGRAPMTNRFFYLPSVGLFLCIYFLAGKLRRAVLPPPAFSQCGASASGKISLRCRLAC